MTVYHNASVSEDCYHGSVAACGHQRPKRTHKQTHKLTICNSSLFEIRDVFSKLRSRRTFVFSREKRDWKVNYVPIGRQDSRPDEPRWIGWCSTASGVAEECNVFFDGRSEQLTQIMWVTIVQSDTHLHFNLHVITQRFPKEGDDFALLINVSLPQYFSRAFLCVSSRKAEALSRSPPCPYKSST